MLKKYTVVGYYEGNGDAFTDHVKAFSPSHALEVVDSQRDGEQWEPCAIFEGHLSDHIADVESWRATKDSKAR